MRQLRRTKKPKTAAVVFVAGQQLGLPPPRHVSAASEGPGLDSLLKQVVLDTAVDSFHASVALPLTGNDRGLTSADAELIAQVVESWTTGRPEPSLRGSGVSGLIRLETASPAHVYGIEIVLKSNPWEESSKADRPKRSALS